MKKNLVLGFALFSIQIIHAQNSGVGTTNPTKTLDVNGELRVRTLPEVVTSPVILAADGQGNVGKYTPKFISNRYTVATAPVTLNFQIPSPGSAGLTYTRDLNIKHTISIPAGAKYAIKTTYSVPMGYDSKPGVVQMNGSGDNAYVLLNTGGVIVASQAQHVVPVNYPGYMGITFYKNGVMVEAATRKYSTPIRISDIAFAMTTISAEFYEVIDNTTGTTAINVEYRLDGYYESAGYDFGSIAAGRVTSGVAKFNMWSATGNNFNWGKASMSSDVYQVL